MANITKRMTKSGAAYRIKVSLGYDETYKQITKSMTYRPAPGMTQRQIKTESKDIGHIVNTADMGIVPGDVVLYIFQICPWFIQKIKFICFHEPADTELFTVDRELSVV